jgi:D-cysteine desulfhydrase
MPLALAQLPTPIHPLMRSSERLGVELWIKRDDLTGSLLSGNKVRKLDFLMEDAKKRGATRVITCGGIQSNHARATAAAARMLHLEPYLLLRGDPPAIPEGNLLLDGLLGARIEWVDEAGYQERDEKMARMAQSLGGAYVIPEGGSNALGALGYLRAARELQLQQLERGIRFDTVICAVGSGGTLAGLVLGGLESRLVGVAVAPDALGFRKRIAGILAEAQGLGFGVLAASRWEILDGFGRGYAKTRPEEIAEARLLAREEGILVDPVYTGKAWYKMVERLSEQPGCFGQRVLFWHTGGIFGWFGRGAEIF